MWWWFFGGPKPKWVKRGKRLRSYKRRGQADQIVLHESVTRTAAGAVKVLKRRKLGVHYSIDRDAEGTVRSHVPIARACSHAGAGHNHRSIAVEVINPYYASRARPGDDILSGVWVHKKEYILPLESQMRSLYRLMIWLVIYADIDISFPGISAGVMRWGRIKDHKVAGVMAHHRWAHADGCFPEAYLYCRSRGMDHEGAWNTTVKAAKAGKRKTRLVAEDLA